MNDIYLLFVWMEQQKQIKKGHPGHFAECNTRQRVALPSAMTMALGKEGNLGTGKAIFAECCGQGTRQRDWQRGPLEDSLSSASPLDTRQRSLLCRVPTRALSTGTGGGSTGAVFAEGHDSRHSVKLASLPSAKEDTRQRIRHRHLAP